MAGESYLIKIQLQIQNDKALKALTSELDRAAKSAPRTQKALKQATAGTKRFGHVAQNTGYQLQDMIVQIQGGTSASRALSQQLPQMLVGFGAIGAAIGVVAALLPPMIAGFADAANESKTLTERINELDTGIGDLSSTVNSLDMSGWVESFNQMDATARNLAASLIEVRIQAQQLELDKAIEQWRGFADTLVMGDIQLSAMANSLGVTVGEMEQLRRIVGEAEAGGGTLLGNPEAMAKIAGILKDNGLKTSLEQLQALYNAQKDLQAARGTSAQAAAAGSSGLIPTGDGDSPSEELEKTASAAVTAAVELNDYKQMLYEAQLGQEQFNATLEQAPEAFSLSDEAVQVFGRSFDTMLDGVLMGTQDIESGITDMVKVVIAQLAKLAAYQFIANAFSGTALGTAAGSLLPSANGNVFAGGNVVPFAKGGVVNSPTLFPMANGAGLMGEAGPEAVMPLSRTASGDLGVKAAPVNVTVNNLAPGVSVQASQTNDGLTIDVVMQQMTTAIRKGGNDLASALEDSYTLGRGRAVY